MTANPRSAITGVAVLGPLGGDLESFFAKLLSGASGLEYRIDPEDETRQAVGRVDDSLLAISHLPSRTRRHADRSTLLGMSVVTDLLSQRTGDLGAISTESLFGLPPERVGVIWGSSSGTPGMYQKAMRAFEGKGREGLKRESPFSAVYASPSATPAMIAQLIGATGLTLTVNTECASSTTAIITGSMMVEAGVVDLVICGGSDATIDSFSLAQVSILGAAASDKFEHARECSRPFDSGRGGFVPAEGACAFIIESPERAALRTAGPVARIYGYGMSTNRGHLTNPDQDAAGLRSALQLAMTSAGATPEDICLYSAHGTGTPQNDPLELEALTAVLGMDRVSSVPVQAIKSNIGHTLAAAGGIEVAVVVESLRVGETPPILNCEDPIPTSACLVRGQPQALEGGLALSSSSGFGGSNAALVLG
jgi:3-oxoacyl-[acyl-carrier-protein] synthase II